MSSTIDNLSGIIGIQNNAISYIQSSSFPDSALLTSLQTNLNNTTSTLSGLDNTVSAAITKQSEMGAIVTEEKTRLDLKKASVDNARDGQKRLILLNDTHRKRSLQYIKIIIAIIVVLAIFAVLKTLEGYFTFIPSGIYDLLAIILFLIGFTYIYYVYSDINNRDLIEYDKLNLKAPNTNTATNPILSQKDGSDLLNPVNACANQSCCDTGTIWNEALGKCKREGFVSNSPSEINDYKFL